MTVKAETDGRPFSRVDGVYAVAKTRWDFTEYPFGDLHVNDAVHGYHA
jgi:hypothetical protein